MFDLIILSSNCPCKGKSSSVPKLREFWRHIQDFLGKAKALKPAEHTKVFEGILYAVKEDEEERELRTDREWEEYEEAAGLPPLSSLEKPREPANGPPKSQVSEAKEVPSSGDAQHTPVPGFSVTATHSSTEIAHQLHSPAPTGSSSAAPSTPADLPFTPSHQNPPAGGSELFSANPRAEPPARGQYPPPSNARSPPQTPLDGSRGINGRFGEHEAHFGRPRGPWNDYPRFDYQHPYYTSRERSPRFQYPEGRPPYRDYGGFYDRMPLSPRNYGLQGAPRGQENEPSSSTQYKQQSGNMTLPNDIRGARS